MTITRRTAAAMLAGALLLGGCATIPQPRTDSEAKWDPIPKQQKLVKDNERFDNVTAESLAQNDSDALRSALSGPLLRTTEAQLALSEKTGDEVPARKHLDPEFVRPSFDDYPIWYVRETAPPKSKNSDQAPNRHELALVQSLGAGDPWRVALQADVPSKKLPELESTAIPNGDDRLGKQPSAIARQFADVLQARTENPDEAKLFTSDDGVDKQLKSNAQWAKEEEESGGGVSISVEAEPSLVRTLSTKDDGALMLFALSVEEHLAVQSGEIVVPDKDDPIRVMLGQEGYAEFLHTVREWTVVARVPSDPSPDQKVELLSVDTDFVEAEGK